MGQLHHSRLLSMMRSVVSMSLQVAGAGLDGSSFSTEFKQSDADQDSQHHSTMHDITFRSRGDDGSPRIAVEGVDHVGVRLPYPDTHADSDAHHRQEEAHVALEQKQPVRPRVNV